MAEAPSTTPACGADPAPPLRKRRDPGAVRDGGAGRPPGSPKLPMRVHGRTVRIGPGPGPGISGHPRPIGSPLRPAERGPVRTPPSRLGLGSGRALEAASGPAAFGGRTPPGPRSPRGP